MANANAFIVPLDMMLELSLVGMSQMQHVAIDDFFHASARQVKPVTD
jgi:hypothetical protein